MTFDQHTGMGGAGRGGIIGAAEGHLIELPGWRMRIKVRASDTGGSLTLIEGQMAAGLPGAPEHVHAGHDEAFFVIDGSLRFRIGDGYREAVAGETVFASRGLAHGFSNPGGTDARYLVALTPSGYEFYFERLAAMIREHGSMPDRETLTRLLAEHATYVATPVG